MLQAALDRIMRTSLDGDPVPIHVHFTSSTTADVALATKREGDRRFVTLDDGDDTEASGANGAIFNPELVEGRTRELFNEAEIEVMKRSTCRAFIVHRSSLID